MAVFFKYIVGFAAFQPIHPKRRLVRDLLAAVLFLCGSLQAQELKFGDPDLFNLPFGTKIIDIGFQNWNFLNVSTIKHANYLLLRWNAPDTTALWLLRIGVPRCEITDQDFELISLFDLEADPYCFNWITPIELGRQREYLLRVAGFDYVIQIISEDLYFRSQYRYIKQKWQP